MHFFAAEVELWEAPLIICEYGSGHCIDALSVYLCLVRVRMLRVGS